MDLSIRSKTPEELARDSIEQCPTCEGAGRVVDLRYGRERRLQCRTCDGTGQIDAGVWPYDTPAAGA